jgi:hypothetical protein
LICFMVPRAGIEPARDNVPRDFKANPPSFLTSSNYDILIISASFV